LGDFFVCPAKLANPVGACHRPCPVSGEESPTRKGVSGSGSAGVGGALNDSTGAGNLSGSGGINAGGLGGTSTSGGANTSGGLNTNGGFNSGSGVNQGGVGYNQAGVSYNQGTGYDGSNLNNSGSTYSSYNQGQLGYDANSGQSNSYPSGHSYGGSQVGGASDATSQDCCCQTTGFGKRQNFVTTKTIWCLNKPFWTYFESDQRDS